jgi:16S rRNA (guanine966-N2)-methyltransferase
MSLKILGGTARGYPLATPKAETTRPTSILIKRKMFDWRQHLDEYFFIDLCAGSGAMGFEALSRGSQKVFLNEMLRPAFLNLKDNKLKLENAFQFDPSSSKVTNLDARSWILKELPYEMPDTSQVILYFDPPYENHALYLEVIKQLQESHFKGEVWIESNKLKGPKLTLLTGLFCSITKVVEQGDHFVVVGKLV